MRADFTIDIGIFLIQGEHRLDLHNFYDFAGWKYYPAHKLIKMRWYRCTRTGIPDDIPQSVAIKFQSVLSFQMLPSDTNLPVEEGLCLSSFGNWNADQNCVAIYDDGIHMSDEPLAIEFMSGAVFIIEADEAHALINSTSS